MHIDLVINYWDVFSSYYLYPVGQVVMILLLSVQ